MRGLFVGRFQPFHKGHASIISEALKDVESLVVVIGSAECSHTPRDPFTSGERIEMILLARDEYGWGDRVVPVPIRDLNRYSIWVDHVLEYIPEIDVVFTNNPLTRILFSRRGFPIRSTPLVDRSELSGEMIRARMVSGGNWEKSVPGSVMSFINGIEGVERVRQISTGGDRP